MFDNALPNVMVYLHFLICLPWKKKVIVYISYEICLHFSIYNVWDFNEGDGLVLS